MSRTHEEMREEHARELPENAAWQADIERWRREQRELLALLARAEAELRMREVEIERHADLVRDYENHVVVHEDELDLRQRAQSEAGLDVLDIEHEKLEKRRDEIRARHAGFSETQHKIFDALKALIRIMSGDEG